jgi:hypothetical protein
VLEAGPLRLRAQVREAAQLRRGMKVFLAVDGAGCALVPRGPGAAYPSREQGGND